jgi:hypothetical protein
LLPPGHTQANKKPTRCATALRTCWGWAASSGVRDPSDEWSELRDPSGGRRSASDTSADYMPSNGADSKKQKNEWLQRKVSHIAQHLDLQKSKI